MRLPQGMMDAQVVAAFTPAKARGDLSCSRPPEASAVVYYARRLAVGKNCGGLRHLVACSKA